MHLARGLKLGAATEKFLADKDLLVFVPEARDLLAAYGDKYLLPRDLAYEKDGRRAEVDVAELAAPQAALDADGLLFPDIGTKTIALFKERIAAAGSVFVNGPAGRYEDPRWAAGTREVWRAIAAAPGYTVIGGGDTISAAAAFTDLDDFSYVCTGGGAMVRFLAGKKLPLIEAMEKAFDRDLQKPIRKNP